MANEEQLAVLKSSVQEWNAFRQGIDPTYIDLRHADLRNADLANANLSEVDLSAANLSDADLRSADLSEASLTGADLHAANLLGARLVLADLREANLENANLPSTDIHDGILIQANLTSANLGRADLADANLYGANLTRANLCWANLTGSNLHQVNFSRAILRETVFADVNLGNLVGLESVWHEGPSIVDHRTLQQSGVLARAFLKGCELPDILIEYLPSMFGEEKPIVLDSCFISHSTKDSDFAKKLHADLRSERVRCWFGPLHIQGGRKIHEQVDEAIRLHDRLLVILSDASMNSEWVKTEISKARKREISEKRRMLFPIALVDFDTLRDWECFDADIGKDSAREIREYFIPDFSTWKTDHNSYRAAFERLLRDLKQEKA